MAERKTTTRKAAAKTGTRTAAKKPAAKAAASGASTARRRPADDQPVTVVIAAMGGEGGGVLTSWLVNAARKANLPVQATSIPGVAQRTGATTYYIEIVPVPYDKLGTKEPVMDLYPGPGEFARGWALDRRFEPAMDEATRDARYAGWRDAVRRTLSGGGGA